MATERLPSCPICASKAVRFHCQKDVARYLVCRHCNFIFQFAPPSREVMISYADAEYSGGLYAEYVRARELKTRHFRDRLAIVTRYLRRGRMLDVGCSCGHFLQAALEAGFDVTGLEFSLAAISAAHPDVRARIVHGTVDDILAVNRAPSAAFDIITAFDVIEHVEDPVGFLGKVSALLCPGGLFILSTPDAGHFLRYSMGSRWPMLQPMQHLSLFSRDSLRVALTGAGFSIVSIEPAYKVLTLGYLISQLRTLNPLLSAIMKAAARCLPARLLEKSRRLNIGEILAVASRRPVS